ncbi:MAG: hypothetical protein CMJ18_13560 [Phycisphaeraceae bacterium]|nr:hypothetical protein [Phycisphaeraceae bacterium]
MKEYGLTLNLKDDPSTIEKYKRHHQAVWPEVERSLRQVGVTSMKIFLLGRRMFMYLTTVDDFEPTRDFARYLTLDPRCQEWEDLMNSFQEKVPEAGPDEWWASMEQVYDLR